MKEVMSEVSFPLRLKLSNKGKANIYSFSQKVQEKPIIFARFPNFFCSKILWGTLRCLFGKSGLNRHFGMT